MESQLTTLAARKFLAPVVRHEFLHALVETQAGPRAPLWLREGLFEAWSDMGGAGKRGSQQVMKLGDVVVALAHAASEAQSEAAHRPAAWYAQRLLDRYGRAQVLEWLHSGLPPAALAQLADFEPRHGREAASAAPQVPSAAWQVPAGGGLFFHGCVKRCP